MGPPLSSETTGSIAARGGRGWSWFLVVAALGAVGYFGYRHYTGSAPWQQQSAGMPEKGGTEVKKGGTPEKAGPTEKGGVPGKGGTVGGPIPVVAIPARGADLDVELAALGTVTPLLTVTVRTRVDGQLMHVYFQEGQDVRKDQLLAEIDSRPFDAVRVQAEGQLARDEALLANARLDLRRYRMLLAQESIALQQVDALEALVRQYEGVVKTDRGVLDQARLQLSYARITAPAPGRVGLRLVDPGNIVRATDTNGLLVITQVQPIGVTFAITQNTLPAILEQTRAGAKVTVVAWDRDQKKKLATGALIAVDNQVDTATGTVKLKARFRNEDHSLFPNQFVNVRLKLKTLSDATVIPAVAIQRGGQGLFVYVVKDDMTVTARPVELGPVDGQRVAVEQGIAPGERVVIDGIDRLREGATVIFTKRPEFKPSVDGTSHSEKGERRRGGEGAVPGGKGGGERR